MSTIEDTMIIPQLRNTSAQILLFLSGSEPKEPKPISKRFTESAEIYSDCAEALEWNLTGFKAAADRILNSRNDSFHFTHEQLEQKVGEAIKTLKNFPSLRESCKNEVRIIEGYDAIK